VNKEITEAQSTELRLDLDLLERELTQLLDATEVGTKPVKLKDNQGRLSRMDELHNQSILKANRIVTSNRLKAVKLAQRRIDDGSYGNCTECDEPIAHNRLKAYPEADKCIECQSFEDSLSR
jgi:DnaK suppressor protein